MENACVRRRGSSGRNTYAFCEPRSACQRTKRPTACRKNNSVEVVVAYTPTRSRGMSTPSLTIRTATIHGAPDDAKRAMRADAVGSSLTTTSAGT